MVRMGIQASATSAAAAIGKDCRLATGNIGRRDRIPSRHVDDGPNLGQEPSRLAWVSTFVNTANHQCRRQVSVRRGTNISVPGHRVAARRLPTTGSCPRHPRSVDAESKSHIRVQLDIAWIFHLRIGQRRSHSMSTPRILTFVSTAPRTARGHRTAPDLSCTGSASRFVTWHAELSEVRLRPRNQLCRNILG
jgi:hypothetical protein